MMVDASSGRLRVVQWATGTVGASAMRAVISHPQLELVGVRVYSEAKDGKDAGELCGMPPIGVRATRDMDAILALKPDCVLYMPESTDMDDVCRLLASGANVVTTRAEFFNPHKMPADVRARVEAACAEGDSSIHASGSSPGFITEALPIVLTSLARRLDLLLIDEFANCIDGCSEEMLLNIMGFGETAEAFAKRQHAERDRVFEDSLSVVADALGLPLERFELTAEFALTRSPTKLHQTTIAAGTVGAQRVTVTGLHQGKPLLRFRSNWFVTMDLEPKWDLRADGWRVLVEGDTPLDISISFPIPADERQITLPRLTAHRPVNAIPYVCAAAPGVRTTADLPQVIARLA
jgi:4-hydroxy-tetrahydrodipicolinate reductase